MTEMVLDGMHDAAERLFRKVLLEIAGDVSAIAALAESVQDVTGADPRGQYIAKLAPAIGAVVAVDGDVLDIGQRNACLGEAISDRFAGEAAPMLDAPEALLLDRRDQDAVSHQASSGIGVVGIEPEDVGHLPDLARARFVRLESVGRKAVL